jgi:hypothetical protein
MGLRERDVTTRKKNTGTATARYGGERRWLTGGEIWRGGAEGGRKVRISGEGGEIAEEE